MYEARSSACECGESSWVASYCMHLQCERRLREARMDDGGHRRQHKASYEQLQSMYCFQMSSMCSTKTGTAVSENGSERYRRQGKCCCNCRLALGRRGSASSDQSVISWGERSMVGSDDPNSYGRQAQEQPRCAAHVALLSQELVRILVGPCACFDVDSGGRIGPTSFRISRRSRGPEDCD